MILFSALLIWTSVQALASGVELHAHLFMKEGMSWIVQGSFNEPLRATSWRDLFKSQTNASAMEKSGLDIVVASLYAHPLFNLSLRDSIRRQIKLANQFVIEYPDWFLAKTPDEAKSALAAHKHVLILALEGAAGILENEQDLVEFVDQGGIRIVTPLHLTDDHFGAVAFLKSFRILSSPLAFLQNLIWPSFDSDGVRLNNHGLKEDGKNLIQELVKRKVWIDLAHSSDAAQEEILPLTTSKGQPLLYTHTALRKYHRAERGIDLQQIKQVAQTGGIIGLMPSEMMLEGTPTDHNCGGAKALAVQFHEIAEITGEDALATGSDYNGGIPHLKPGCPTGTELDQEAGLWNIGQSQEIWKALKNLGVWHPDEKRGNITSRFLEAWSKLYN